jgi:hypothetical protein
LFIAGVGFTSDFWKEPHTKKDYISLTLHFFKDCRIRSFVLKSDEFAETDKTAETISDWFDKMLNEFIFQPNYILVTDSGSNFVCAFKNQDTRISCIAHSIHLAMNMLFTSITSASTVDSVGHLLGNLIQECTDIAVLFSRSKPAELKKTIKMSTPTRWNSRLTMFKSILDQFEDISTILNKRHNFELSFSKDSLTELCSFLQPFEEMTCFFSSTTEPTLNCVVPYLKKTLLSLESSDDESPSMLLLKRLGINALETKVFPKLSPIHFAATMLDFRFRQMSYTFTNCSLTSSDGKLWILNWMNGIDSIETALEEDFSTDDPLMFETSFRPQHNELNDYLHHQSNAFKRFYFSSKFDVFKCWDAHQVQFPKLFKIANWIHSVPASSVASESTFSKAKWLINPRRSLIKPEMANNCLILNSSYAQETV